MGSYTTITFDSFVAKYKLIKLSTENDKNISLNQINST